MTVAADSTTPTVLSITRVSVSPSAKASVQFLVTFSEAVTGVTAADFSLTKTGITAGSVTGVSGSGAMRTVTVNTGSGNGTLRLDIPNTAIITDLIGNGLTSLPFTSAERFTPSTTGRPAKYGAKINVRKLGAKYLKGTSIENDLRTDIYQGQLFNKEFGFALNVVILVKTNLETNAQAHVILFSTDLEQAYDKIIKFYSLRFQIEFNFRDANQYWGLEDFTSSRCSYGVNVKETAVTNAATYRFLWSISVMRYCNHLDRQILITAFSI